MTNENGKICIQHLGKKPWSHDEKFSEKISLMFSAGQKRKGNDRSYQEKKRQPIKYIMPLFS